MGHYYDHSGKPKHTMPTKSKNAKKPFRDTTIKDARSLSLLPSFSGISDQLDKPGLNLWRTDLEIKALVEKFRTASFDLKDDELINDLIKEAARNASAEANSYSELGTQIHNALESYLLGEPYDKEYEDHINAFWKALCDYLECPREEIEIILVEASFGAPNFGFGGTIDLIVRVHGKYILIDLKTKKTKANKECFISESNLMQLPAYKRGFNLQGHVKCLDPKMKIGWKPPIDSRMMLVIVSTTEEGRAEVREINKEEDSKYWILFKRLIDIWILRNDHDPRIFD